MSRGGGDPLAGQSRRPAAGAEPDGARLLRPWGEAMVDPPSATGTAAAEPGRCLARYEK